MRHRYEVTRWQRATGEPFVKRCAVCGKTLRHHRGRWVVTTPGKPRLHAS